MGTRATIRIKDGEDEYFIYRGHDGFPENILPDIEDAIEKSKNRWSGADAGCFVAFFFGVHFDIKKRLPTYELTPCWHGDESYRYYVDWKDNEWLVAHE